MNEANPTGALDDVIHQRHRLGILTIAAESDRVEFTYLRDTLGLTAGNLNRHLGVLEDAGAVATTKELAGRRTRTWVRITAAGRVALEAEIATLRLLVERHSPKSAPTATSAERPPRPAARHDTRPGRTAMGPA